MIWFWSFIDWSFQILLNDIFDCCLLTNDDDDDDDCTTKVDQFFDMFYTKTRTWKRMHFKDLSRNIMYKFNIVFTPQPLENEVYDSSKRFIFFTIKVQSIFSKRALISKFCKIFDFKNNQHRPSNIKLLFPLLNSSLHQMSIQGCSDVTYVMIKRHLHFKLNHFWMKHNLL